ncbi:hypothetical protein LUZ61_008847 [Rhynchospora tenuis]|uniref:F-box/LRR-repeat protein 15/At3g58940/PEG3-like LRR domain-containing protein n=1 Tax=Rhynchospora tenuis TaxID=198213 RepID=A0AAD5ZWB3_9POAL|nr:hypothetical protein LUZ61_008847 [Rhynchospora tenuis]
MLILSRNVIRDLDLSLGLEERCKIPSRLVSCHALEHLKLSGCIINVPRFFQGFKLLRTLWLEFFDLSGISIGNLISSCPLLEDLALSIEQPGCLHILAPNLRQLNIWGEFHDLCLETPKLASGSICVVSYGDYRQFSVAKTGKKNNFTQTLGSLHNVQKLALIGQFIDYLAVGAVPKNLPMNFNRLIELSVHVCCYDQNQTASALCLFQNAPNLRVLHIEFMDYWGDDHSQVQIFWKLEATETCLFKSLEIVKVGYFQSDESSFRRTESLVEFSELVQSTAPVLGKLNIIDFEDAVVFCTKLENFSKLSKKAKIAVVNRWN